MSNLSVSTADDLSFLGAGLIRPEQYKILSGRPYIVKNLLLASQVSMLAGPPNTGKSSIVAMLTAKVAIGEDIGHFRTKQAAVIINAAEDDIGIIERAHGHLANPPAHFPGLFVTHRPLDLRDSGTMDQVIASVEAIKTRTGAERLMVVFDTLNLCIGDGDENSSRDMSQVIGNAQRLAKETEAHVMIVHHTSAADPAKPRGSTALRGNVDTLLVLGPVQDDGGRTLAVMTQEKQRSVQKGAPVFFEIAALEVGFDEDGDLVTVPMARIVPRPSNSVERDPARRGKQTLAERRAQVVLRVLEGLDDQTPDAFHSPATISARVGDDFEKAQLKPDSLRRKVKDALDDLVDQGAAETNGRGYRILSDLVDREDNHSEVRGPLH